MRLFKPPFVVQATVQMGYPEPTIVGIGIALLACTGYLGGGRQQRPSRYGMV